LIHHNGRFEHALLWHPGQRPTPLSKSFQTFIQNSFGPAICFIHPRSVLGQHWKRFFVGFAFLDHPDVEINRVFQQNAVFR
jgi:hypothetical protein